MTRCDGSEEEAVIVQFLRTWNVRHPGTLISVGELAQRLALTELEVYDALITLDVRGLVTTADLPTETPERDITVRITALGEENRQGQAGDTVHRSSDTSASGLPPSSGAAKQI